MERFTLSKLLRDRGQYEEALRVATIFGHPEPAIFLPFIRGSLGVRVRAAEELGYNDLAESYRFDCDRSCDTDRKRR